jgi:alkyldihydroxyacetonephosphate synthase
MDARRRKFYGWGYADEGASADEIRLLEKTLAARFGIRSFDVTPAPRADKRALDPKGMLNPGVLIDPER